MIRRREARAITFMGSRANSTQPSKKTTEPEVSEYKAEPRDFVAQELILMYDIPSHNAVAVADSIDMMQSTKCTSKAIRQVLGKYVPSESIEKVLDMVERKYNEQ